MKLRAVVLVLVCSALAAARASAQQSKWKFFEYGAELQWWWASLDSEIRAGNATDSKVIRFEDEFDLDTAEDIPHLELSVSPAEGHTVSFAYDTVNYSGSRRLSRNVLFDDILFGAGTLADAELKVRHAHMEYKYRFYDDPNWKSDVHVGLSAFSIKSEVRGTDATLGLPATGGRSDTSVLPTVGFGATYVDEEWVENLQLHFVVWGMPTRSQGSVLDARGEAILKLHRYVSVALGYRVAGLKTRSGDNRSDLVIGGPYASVMLSY